jgi:hypothetical protein
MENSSDRYTLPAGKYYLGDPCYVWPDDLWMDFCHELENSALIDTKGYGYAVALSTAYGDGVYPGNHGLPDLGVDAGLIGLVPLQYVIEHGEGLETAEKLGAIVEFDTSVEVWDEDGTLHFGAYEVYTACDEDEEEEW